MKQELREVLGKAVWLANEAHRKEKFDSLGLVLVIPWEDLPQEDQEALMRCGESAVAAFVQVVLPSAQQVVAAIREMCPEQLEEIDAVVEAFQEVIGGLVGEQLAT